MSSKRKHKRLIDFSGAKVVGGYHKNLKIKVNGDSLFYECTFVNCTFFGRGKERAMFKFCNFPPNYVKA